jgi:hypothetical protein
MFVQIVAVFIAGAVIGSAFDRLGPSDRPPPRRVTLHLTLDGDDFFGTAEAHLYAQALAGELAARFHRPRSKMHIPDLEVVAPLPACSRARSGCAGKVRWAFEMRSKQPIDARVVSVAAGRGNLALRAVEDGDPVTCDAVPSENATASVTEPFVPLALSDKGCLRLGPVLHNVVQVSALPFSADTVNVIFVGADTSWLVDWSRSHRDGELALVLDGWIIGRARAQTVAEAHSAVERARTIGNIRPMQLPSVAVPREMYAAILLAIDSASAPTPRFEPEFGQ